MALRRALVSSNVAGDAGSQGLGAWIIPVEAALVVAEKELRSVYDVQGLVDFYLHLGIKTRSRSFSSISSISPFSLFGPLFPLSNHHQLATMKLVVNFHNRTNWNLP